MNDEKQQWWYMVLFGFVRHGLMAAGAWLTARGWIDADTGARLISEGTTQIVGLMIMGGSLAWSWYDKKRAQTKVSTALNMPTGASNEDLTKVMKATGPGIVPTPAQAAAIVQEDQP